MHNNFNTHLHYTATGITVEVVARHSGRVIASREISAEAMRHWVAEHADRSAAVAFDTAITLACDRTNETVQMAAALIEPFSLSQVM